MADRDALRRVPPRQRTLLALLIVPVGLALLACGLLVAIGTSGLAGRLAGGLIGALAVVLLGVAHGLFSSARRDRAEQRLDRAIQAVAGACGSAGASACDSCAGACTVNDCAVKALPRH